MSKPTFVRIFVVLAGLFALSLLLVRMSSGSTPSAWPRDREDLLRRAVHVPGGVYEVGSREPGCYPAGRVSLSEYAIWPVEVTRHAWLGGDPDASPAASVSYEEAVAWCSRMSERYGVTIRLPTVDEWQVAARAGTPGVTYPWGWALPFDRAVFDATGAQPVASHQPNPWGLYDMAGNVAEWCQADDDSATAPALGGSWAERSPDFLRISHRLALPKTYRDADVGFRFVIEIYPPR